MQDMLRGDTQARGRSASRGAWIEISGISVRNLFLPCRSASRGAWIEISETLYSLAKTAVAPPRAERGLKYKYKLSEQKETVSLRLARSVD